MIISKKDLALIAGWFEHIQQMADDRKTLTGNVMSESDTLDEIKALSVESANFIKKHYLSEQTKVKPRNSSKMKPMELHKRTEYKR